MNTYKHINPYIHSLREQIRRLRIELLFLLNQWYYIKSTIYPDVQHKYKNLFGDLIIDLDEKKMKAYTMDNRVREIISKINSKKVINHNFVLNTYNLKFDNKEYISTFSDNYDIFEQITKEFHKRFIPECDVNTDYEIAQLYRLIAKKIHPDLNGENEAFNKYWNNIQDSYQTRNVFRLRLFYKLICEEIPEIFPDNRSEELFLKTQIQQLEKSIFIEKQKIQKIKSEEPFCYEEQISDFRWIRKKRYLLTEEIKKTEQIIDRNKSILKRILDNNNSQKINS